MGEVLLPFLMATPVLILACSQSCRIPVVARSDKLLSDSLLL